jgi:hypothetical protein
MSSKTPFDIIIITSPDYPSSLAVRELIISSCGQFPSHYLASQDAETTVLYSDCGTVFVSTCDPFGARMGRCVCLFVHAVVALCNFLIDNVANTQ